MASGRKIFRKIDQLMTLQGAAQKSSRKVFESDLSILEKAAMVVESGKVLWVGSDKKIPREFRCSDVREINLSGGLVMPGFVECHTHTLFAGSRSSEFEKRLGGVSYQEIAKAGGGILSTVRATRTEIKQKLISTTQRKVQKFLEQGVTSLEVKTGYALDFKNELKSLDVIAKLKGPRIYSTFLGAHSVPPEFSSARSYLEELKTWLPKIRKKTSRLDIWIEKGFFEADFSKSYLELALELGFQLTIHADQLSLSGGSDLALRLQALSADHVIQIDAKTIQRFGQSKTVAVLLPAADLYMRCSYPPARAFIDGGACVALATDFNPGTCPTQDLALVGLLARLEMKMTLPEVISAYTLGATQALGNSAESGALIAGSPADFVLREHEWTELFYNVGAMTARKVFISGSEIKI